MKTSLTETQHLEHYLLGKLSPEEMLVMEANLIVNEDLKDKLHWQDKTYQLIRASGRQQLRSELDAVHNQLFTAVRYRKFQTTIGKIFNLPL